MKTAYETMFLLPPATTVEQVDDLIERLKKSVEKKAGEIIRIDKMGVRKTAYEIHKVNSAYYVLFQFQGNGETIGEVERTLKNADEVWKFLSTKIIAKKAPVTLTPRPNGAQTSPGEAAPAEATPAAENLAEGAAEDLGSKPPAENQA